MQGPRRVCFPPAVRTSAERSAEHSPSPYRGSAFISWSLAGEPGFEPGQGAPKTPVLPLHHSPKRPEIRTSPGLSIGEASNPQPPG